MLLGEARVSRAPDGVSPAEFTIVARRVLLDALELLGAHAHAITVVGAQAVYLRTHEVELGIAAFTSDADLCLDKDQLKDEPLLQEAMERGGFSLREHQPGLWQKKETFGSVSADVQVDLLVPATFAGRGRRSVQMPPHHKSAAKRVPGLEPCLVDRDLMVIRSLAPSDDRTPAVQVAGPAALLIAKAYKIHERVTEVGQQRVQYKDAGDVVRIMQSDSGDPDEIADRIRRLRADDRTADITKTGLQYLRQLFGARNAEGTQAAVTALEGAMDQSSVETLVPAYLNELEEILG